MQEGLDDSHSQTDVVEARAVSDDRETGNVVRPNPMKNQSDSEPHV